VQCKSLPGNLLHQILDRLAAKFPFLFLFSFPPIFKKKEQKKSGNTVAEWFQSSMSVKVKCFPLVGGGDKQKKSGR